MVVMNRYLVSFKSTLINFFIRKIQYDPIFSIFMESIPMQQNHSAEPALKISVDQSIETIRAYRDECLKQLLNDSRLMDFLEAQYDVFQISTVRKEFLKRDLTDLKNSPLDLVHYAALIRDLKGGTATVADHPLFLEELRNIFKKYSF